jgi:Na+-transporting methylmalonyl-CoA/oxaloacetate decarboxylase gamma subunit
MHWIPKDLTTWAFIFSVLALVLMYPVGVLINITTPRLQNRWAARSRSALQARIARLEGELNRMPGLPEVSEVEDMILRRSQLALKILFICFDMLFSILTVISFCLGLIVAVVFGVLSILIMYVIGRFVDRSEAEEYLSPSRKRTVELSIAELQSKLRQPK